MIEHKLTQKINWLIVLISWIEYIPQMYWYFYNFHGPVLNE